MSDERTIEHIGGWIATLRLPAHVELRCGSDIIDSLMATEDDAPFHVLAKELVDSAGSDALNEGRSRTYKLVGIQPDEQRFVCPLTIRRRVDKSASDLVALLTKQNTELHELLRKERKESASMLLRLLETVESQNRRLVDDNVKHQNRASEVITLVENLRSKDLERTMAREEHDSKKEMRERMTNVAVPLLAAVASKFSGGQVPGPNTNDVVLLEIVTSLDDNQLDTLQRILGERWLEFKAILADILDKHPRLPEFKRFVQSVPAERSMAMLQILNVGQQAAIRTILEEDAHGN